MHNVSLLLSVATILCNGSYRGGGGGGMCMWVQKKKNNDAIFCNFGRDYFKTYCNSLISLFTVLYRREIRFSSAT